MQIASEAVELVKRSEGLRLKAYPCPAGVWTIGYGHTAGVEKGDTWTKAQADKALREDLQYHADTVLGMCKVVPSPLQLGAMASLAFNIGNKAFKGSSVLRLHNQRKFDAAGRAFNMWVKATVNGKKVELPGLVIRRAEEAALYLRGSVEFENQSEIAPIAQHVEPEERPARGATVTVSTLTGGAAAISAGTQVVRAMNEAAPEAKTFLGLAKDYGPAALCVVIMVFAGYLIYRRYKTRDEGWL